MHTSEHRFFKQNFFRVKNMADIPKKVLGILILHKKPQSESNQTFGGLSALIKTLKRD